MAKVGPNAVNLAIAEMIGQLLTFTTHPNGGTGCTGNRTKMHQVKLLSRLAICASLEYFHLSVKHIVTTWDKV